MASNIIYIHDLPFKPRNQLCRILDADGRWRDLGGNHMHYDVTTITLIGQSIQRDKSPTWELLNKYSERNGTIKNLFIMLAKMNHQRAMSILQPYVEQKYHVLLQNERTLSSTLYSCSKKEDIPRPSSSMLSSQSSYQWSRASSVSGTSDKVKEHLHSKTSKFNTDLANINQNFSSLSLRSKSLNVAPGQAKYAVGEKLPDSKKINNRENSVSDNCVSEKIKNKLSVQELMLNGKQVKQPSHLPCAPSFNSQEDCLPDIMHIPYMDICKATDNFNVARILGRGGFGTVYRGEWKGTSVAIKRLIPRESSDGPSQQLVSIKQSLNELNILKCCRFDHILPLYAVSLDGTNPCLIYQLMVNGSLEDRLLCKNKTPPLTWSQRSHIAECTTKGLNYLHTTPGKPLVHGDIKSANILLDANMDAKIGDFGLTREGPGCDATHVKVTSVHGTECYLPPEYLRQRHLSPQVDIYSYGIVLLEIATGLRPFDPKRGETKRLVDHVRICNDSGRLDSLRDTKAGEENMIWFGELIQIGQSCSSIDKKKRPPLQDVLRKFEKMKEEMSVMDKIRRLSSDRDTSPKPLRLNTDMNLSPMEIQLYYDYQNQGQIESSNKSPSSSRNPINGHVSPVLSVMKNMSSINTDESGMRESSFESLGRRTSYISSEDNVSDGESFKVTKQSNPEESQTSGSSDGKAPIPLLTVLQMQVCDGAEDTASHMEKFFS